MRDIIPYKIVVKAMPFDMHLAQRASWFVVFYSGGRYYPYYLTVRHQGDDGYLSSLDTEHESIAEAHQELLSFFASRIRPNNQANFADPSEAEIGNMAEVNYEDYPTVDRAARAERKEFYKQQNQNFAENRLPKILARFSDDDKKKLSKHFKKMRYCPKDTTSLENLKLDAEPWTYSAKRLPQLWRVFREFYDPKKGN